FDLDEFSSTPTDVGETETLLHLVIKKQQSLGRANTFFNKYSDAQKLSNWFIETFFPFFMENESLQLIIDFDGNKVSLNREFIERNVKSVPFEVIFDE